VLSIFNILFTYFSEILSVVLVLIILSGRKEARANFAWLMTVIFFPVVGALIYIIFGNPRIRYIVEKKMKRYRELDIKQYYKSSSGYEYEKMGETITKVSGISPQLCSNLKFITVASEKYNALEKDIENAKEYIFMEYYLFRDDVVGRRFAKLLSKKASEGVKVYFMVDGWGSMRLLISDIMRDMRKAGVNTSVFHSPFGLKTVSRVNFRNHRKIVVIDGDIAYMGGMNVGEEYIDGTKWVDAHLRFEGDAVNSVAMFFAEDWMFSTREDISDLVNKCVTSSGGEKTVHIIPSGPHQDSPLIYDSLFTAMNRAEKSVDIITPYLVPNMPMIETLKNISRQGVKVRIIVPGVNNHPLVAAAGRSYYEELIENGVEIYETIGTMLHAKIVVIDGFWVTVGSANMDARSFKLNFEINMFVYSGSFSKEVTDVMGEYLKASRRIDIDSLKNRHFAVRVLEGVCRTLSPVL
jgi:cardiolipin synthase